MAKNQEQVMEFVKKELKSNPQQSTSDLYEKAKGVDEGIKTISLRQFNARYPLQIKRKQSLAKGGGRRGSTRRRRRSARRRRDSMRELFLEFATELSAAEERKDVVQVLSQVDNYVAKALKIGGR